MSDKKSERGFASMDENRQREIASKGGQSVAPEDRSFSRNHALAAEAGRKGGQASHSGRGQAAGAEGSASQGLDGGHFTGDPKRAAEAGRKGGQSSRGGT